MSGNKRHSWAAGSGNALVIHPDLRQGGDRRRSADACLDEAKRAREAFLTSTTSYVMPVVQIDDSVIGNGRPGSATLRLRECYAAFIQGDAKARE